MDNKYFRKLDTDEEKKFRQHARKHFKFGDEILEIWHPVYRDECQKIALEWQIKEGEGGDPE